MVFVKTVLGLLLITLSTTGFAAGSTAWAVPIQVDVMYQGIMVYGAFGNPGGCTTTDRFFVATNTGQYKEILATLMAAYATGKEVATYVDTCASVTWYAVPSTTFGYMTTGGVIYVRN